MASRVRDRQLIPRNGYSFKEADGTVFTANTLKQLHHKVRQHRIANHRDLSTKEQLDIEIEGQICAERPHLCKEDTGELTVVKLAGNFASSLIRWRSRGFPVVDEAVFNTRRDICFQCPHWKGWSDAGIGICNICGCVTGRLSLKLWMGSEKCPDNPSRW